MILSTTRWLFLGNMLSEIACHCPLPIAIDNWKTHHISHPLMNSLAKLFYFRFGSFYLQLNTCINDSGNQMESLEMVRSMEPMRKWEKCNLDVMHLDSWYMIYAKNECHPPFAAFWQHTAFIRIIDSFDVRFISSQFVGQCLLHVEWN